jgi:hypothetical protein
VTPGHPHEPDKTPGITTGGLVAPPRPAPGVLALVSERDFALLHLLSFSSLLAPSQDDRRPRRPPWCPLRRPRRLHRPRQLQRRRQPHRREPLFPPPFSASPTDLGRGETAAPLGAAPVDLGYGTVAAAASTDLLVGAAGSTSGSTAEERAAITEDWAAMVQQCNTSADLVAEGPVPATADLAKINEDCVQSFASTVAFPVDLFGRKPR